MREPPCGIAVRTTSSDDLRGTMAIEVIHTEGTDPPVLNQDDIRPCFQRIILAVQRRLRVSGSRLPARSQYCRSTARRVPRRKRRARRYKGLSYNPQPRASLSRDQFPRSSPV